MTKILVVDDEPQIRRALAHEPGGPRLRGHRRWAPARKGVLGVAELAPDLVLLDLGLPDMDGTEVVATHPRVLRGAGDRAVGPRGTSRTRWRALDAGADDYVTKPFAMEELLARARAALRRPAAGGACARRSSRSADSRSTSRGAS